MRMMHKLSSLKGHYKRYLMLFILTFLKRTLIVKYIMFVDFVPRKSEHSGIEEANSHRKRHQQRQKPRRRLKHHTDCGADWKNPCKGRKHFFRCSSDTQPGGAWILTVMHGHAVLLPAVSLVNPAGVGEGPLIGQRRPGEATQCGVDQADVAPPAVLHGHVDDVVGVSAAHQPTVLPILAVGAGHLVCGREFTVHPNISLQVS